MISLLFGACKKEVPENPNLADLNDFQQTVLKYYPFLELKEINLNETFNKYIPLVKGVSNSVFRSEFKNLLTEFKDGHANIYSLSGRPEYGYPIPRMEKDKEAFDLGLVRTYLNKEFKVIGNVYRYEIMDNNIGYIHYESFTGSKSIYEQFDNILAYIRNTQGLIIDIRHNGGGNNISSYYMIKRLIASPLEGVNWIKKGGGLTAKEIYHPEGDYQYTKPIVVLINGVSFSSAEGFANLCKKVPHITLLGDTTGGGGGVPEIFTLKYSKIKFRFPTKCEMRYDGEHLEWNGIPPDILVKQGKTDIENKTDKQLESAISFLSSQALI